MDLTIGLRNVELVGKIVLNPMGLSDNHYQFFDIWNMYIRNFEFASAE